MWCLSFLDSDTATATLAPSIHLSRIWITPTGWQTGLEIWVYARGQFWHLALRYLTLSVSRRKVLGKTLFFIFLRTSLRSIALFPVHISFETPVRLISSEAHSRCAQKRLGFYLNSLLLLLDFNKNWEGVDKAWCNSLCQLSRIPAVPHVFYSDILADTSKLKRIFATVRCELRKSETRVNKLQEYGVSWNYPITGFIGEGSWCSCVTSGFRSLEVTWNWFRLPVPIICSKIIGRSLRCMKRSVFLGNVEIQNAVSSISVCGIGNICTWHLYINAHQYLPQMLKEFCLDCDVMWCCI